MESSEKPKKPVKAKKGGGSCTLKKAFHGRSGYTLSLTNTADPKKYMYFPKHAWPRITPQLLLFPLTPSNQAKVEDLEKKAL
ncbi:MAG: hypothetical protein R3A45_02370 [Bdellovibrionota bacterium]